MQRAEKLFFKLTYYTFARFRLQEIKYTDQILAAGKIDQINKLLAAK